MQEQTATQGPFAQRAMNSVMPAFDEKASGKHAVVAGVKAAGLVAVGVVATAAAVATAVAVPHGGELATAALTSAGLTGGYTGLYCALDSYAPPLKLRRAFVSGLRTLKVGCYIVASALLIAAAVPLATGLLGGVALASVLGNGALITAGVGLGADGVGRAWRASVPKAARQAAAIE